MKRRIFVVISALILSTSALIVSIGLDMPIIFFIGLALILILDIFFMNMEIRYCNKIFLNHFNKCEYNSAITFIESKINRCYFAATRYLLISYLCSLYLIVDRYSDAKNILNDQRNTKIKTLSYYRFITSICDGNVNAAKSHLQALNSIHSKAYLEQIGMANKIYEMVIAKNVNQEIREKSKFPCVTKLCEKIENGEYTVLEDSPKVTPSDNKNKLGRNWRIPSILLIVGSAISLFAAMIIIQILATSSPIPEANVMTEFMWVFYLFIPITIASVIFGIIAKAKVNGCTANIIVGIILTFVLSIFGSFSLINDLKIYHDIQYVEIIENVIRIDLPKEGYVVHQKRQTNNIDTTYVRFDDKSKMLSCIQSNPNWMTNLDQISSNNIPVYDLTFSKNYQYFLLFDANCSSYNVNSSDHKEHEFYYLAYNESSNLLYASHYYQSK